MMTMMLWNNTNINITQPATTIQKDTQRKHWHLQQHPKQKVSNPTTQAPHLQQQTILSSSLQRTEVCKKGNAADAADAADATLIVLTCLIKCRLMFLL